VPSGGENPRISAIRAVSPGSRENHAVTGVTSFKLRLRRSRADMRAEPLFAHVRAVVFAGALPAVVRAELQPVVRAVCAKQAVLALLRWEEGSSRAVAWGA
jgi:hypothetical protein